jgi:hypothetical protein
MTSVDLLAAKPGTSFYGINTGNLTLPNDRIHVVNINPTRIELTFEKRSKSNQGETSSVAKEPT